MLNFRPTPTVCKFLESLQQKTFNQIWGRILDLLKDPRPHDSIKLKGKTASEDRYRVDSGEYRIIYFFDPKNLWVSLIGKRNDGEVYKKAKRKK